MTILTLIVTEKAMDYVLGLASGETSVPPSDLEGKLSVGQLSYLLQVVQGSLNEPACTVWMAMHEYAKYKG